MKTVAFELEIEDFGGNGRELALVHLIWQVPLGASNSPPYANLMCIHTSSEMAEKRLSGLRNHAKGEEIPYKYFKETVVLDHLFGSSIKGILDEEDAFVKQLVSNTFSVARHHESQMKELRDQATEKITRLREELATANRKIELLEKHKDDLTKEERQELWT